MKIVAFLDNIFPKETLLGLLTIAENSEKCVDFIFISPEANQSSPFDDHLIYGTSNHVLSKNRWAIIRHILTSDIVIGMPSTFGPLRILSRLGLLGFLPLYLGPGKVTKAIGYYKHPDAGHFNQFKTFLKFVSLNTYYLANDEIDRVYTAAALGYPLGRIIVSKLPKYFYINEKLSSRSGKDRKAGILFAPTHRWSKKLPPLTEMLSKPLKLGKYSSDDVTIYHSKHPETPSMLFDNSVVDFDTQWSYVDILVTDYSSIGDDFLNSGGKHVVYFVPDRSEFERNQGKGIFFDNSLSEGYVCFTEAELCEKLTQLVAKNIQIELTERFIEPHYFTKILNSRL
jgi:hypothetical protein